MSTSGYQDAAEKTKALARQEHNKRKRILVVEDDRLSLALLKQLLEVHGYEILETPGGLEAIDIARDQQPDLILMDIRLPDICGLDRSLETGNSLFPLDITLRPSRLCPLMCQI